MPAARSNPRPVFVPHAGSSTPSSGGGGCGGGVPGAGGAAPVALGQRLPERWPESSVRPRENEGIDRNRPHLLMDGEIEPLGEHRLHHRHQLVPARLPARLRLNVKAVLADPRRTANDLQAVDVPHVANDVEQGVVGDGDAAQRASETGSGLTRTVDLDRHGLKSRSRPKTAAPDSSARQQTARMVRKNAWHAPLNVRREQWLTALRRFEGAIDSHPACP